MATHVMTKLGIGSSSTLFVNQGIVPVSLQSGMSMVKEPSHENPAGSISQLVKSVPNSTFVGNYSNGKTVVSPEKTSPPINAAVNTRNSSRTETVLNNFLTNPLLKDEDSSISEQVCEFNSFFFFFELL